MKTTQINDILQDVLCELNAQLHVSSFEYNAETNITKLFVCDTGFIDNCYKSCNGCCDKTITIKDKFGEVEPIEFKVNDFEYCEYIEIKGQLTELENKKNCYIICLDNPRWIEGSYPSVSNEVDQIQSCDKYPLVYLFNPLKESFINDYKLCYDREVRATIFFVGLIDIKGAVNVNDKNVSKENCFTDDFKTQAKPMRNLAETYIEALEKSKAISEVLNYDITVYNCFAKEKNNEAEWFFNDFTNGIQLDIVFRTKKGYSKKGCCIKC